MLELLLFLVVGLPEFALPLDLLFPAPLNLVLECLPPALLLFKELDGLLFGLLYLLVEDLVFFVLHVFECLCLPLDESLPRALFLLEFLFLAVLLELVEFVLLAAVLLDLFLLVGLLQFILELLIDQFLVGLDEGVLLLHLSLLALGILLGLA